MGNNRRVLHLDVVYIRSSEVVVRIGIDVPSPYVLRGHAVPGSSTSLSIVLQPTVEDQHASGAEQEFYYLETRLTHERPVAQ